MKKPGMIKTLTITSLSAIALATPIAFAQSTSKTQDPQQATGERHGGGRKDWGERGNRERRGWDREGGGRMGGMMFRGINLTDDQKAKLKEIGESFRGRTQPLRDQLRAKRQELHQASEGGTFNEALATQKLQESASLEAKLMGEQFRMRQETLAVLTPEQKTQLEQKRAEFKARKANQGEQKVQ